VSAEKRYESRVASDGEATPPDSQERAGVGVRGQVSSIEGDSRRGAVPRGGSATDAGPRRRPGPSIRTRFPGGLRDQATAPCVLDGASDEPVESSVR
jgi:hypothetical protein